MAIARVVQNGNVQTLILPKEIHLLGGEVEIFQRGEEVVLRQRHLTGAQIFDVLAQFPEDFMAGGREDASPQEREGL